MKFIFLIAMYATSLFAADLKVDSLIPSGNYSSEVKKIYIKFDKDLIALGQKDETIKNKIFVNDKLACEKIRFIGTSQIECQLEKALAEGEYKIKIAKGIISYKKEELKTDFTQDLIIKYPAIVQKTPNIANVIFKRKEYEDRFILSSFNCYPKNVTLSSYYQDENLNLPVHKEISCESGREVNFYFRGFLDDKDLIEIFVPDSDFAKKANAEALKNFKENNTYSPGIKFTLPKEEGVYQLNFSKKFVGRSKKDGSEKNPLTGTLQFTLSVDPVSPKFQIRKGNLVYERNGTWKIPFEYVNIDEIKYKATLKPKEKPKTGVYKLDMNRNEAHSFYFDFENALGLEKSKSHQVKLSLETSNVADDLQESFLKYGRNYWQEEHAFHVQSDFFIQTTNLGVHFKKGFFNHMTFVFSLDKGEPIAGADVILQTSDGKTFKTQTNEDGIANHDNKFKANIVKVSVSKGDDTFELNNLTSYEEDWNKGIRPWDFLQSFEKLEDKNNFLVEVVTDRPIYKPGEEVQLKIFTRKWGNKFLESDPSLKTVLVTIRDSRGEKVLEQKINLNQYGTAVTKTKLKVDAKTGDYKVSVSNQHVTRTLEPFKVEEFRTPTIKVRSQLTLEKQIVKFDATAEYYFGGGLADAPGEILLAYKPQRFTPSDKSLQVFFDNYYDDYYYTPSFRLLKKMDVNFDKNGKFTDQYELKDLDLEDYGELVIEANTKDANGAKIASRSSLKIGKKYFVGLKTKQWSYQVGNKAEIQAVMLDAQNKVYFDKKAKLTLYRVEYETVRRKGAGNYYYYDYKENKIEVEDCGFKFSKDFSACKLKIDKAGTYYYEVTSNDSDFEFNKASGWFYAWGGEGYISQKRYNHPRIDVLMDKSDYELGETAKILIKSPYDEADAIITLERAGVIESKRIKLKSSLHQLEWKIDKDYYLPGFYLSVLIVKGRTSEKVEGNLDLGKPSFYLGYAKTNVTAAISHLNVMVEGAEENYEPKENVDLEVEVQNYQGKGEQSELAIAVVDEAILDLVSGYLSKYDIHNTFYKLQGISIENFNNLVNLVGRQSYGKKGGNAGGGGGFDSTTLRKDFKAVAYWNPQLETDKKGRAKVSFVAPDNLTTWKTLIVAVDKQRRFGLGQTAFKVNKKLMIEPALPNFLTEYDWFDGKFVVHNRSKEKLSVEFKLASDEFIINKKDEIKKVESNGKVDFSLPINTKEAGKKYKILATAKGSKYSDAVLKEIPVIPMRSNNINVISGSLNGNEFVQDLLIPTTAREGSQKLTLTYSGSMLGQVKEVFKYVLQYPYGCWEQKMSKAIFWGLYAGMESQLNLDLALEHEPKKVVQEFLDLAPKYQDNEGGFKFYPSGYGSTSQYLSFYTANVFIILEDLGFSIDGKVKSNLAKYLEALLKKDSYYPDYYQRESKDSLKAMVLYTLAKWKHGNWQDEFVAIAKSDLSQFNIEALSYLLKTAYIYQGTSKKTKSYIIKISKQIDNYGRANAGYINYSTPQKSYKYFLQSEMKNQCQVFSAFLDTKLKKAEYFDKQLNYIFSKRTEGHWYNTQENMFCFTAAYDYLKSNKISEKALSIKSMLDNQLVATTSIPKKITKPIVETIPKLAHGKQQTFKLVPSNDKKVFYTLKLEYLDLADSTKNIDNGFEVNKYLYLMNKEKNTWEPLEGDIQLKRGDILKVVITVKSEEDRYQVGINDPLAGAFEPINFNLDNTSLTTKLLKEPIEDKRYSRDKWEYYSDYFYGRGFHYADLRLQAVQFYADELNANKLYYVEYAVSVIATGNFLIDSTIVEEMYYPDVHGLTKTQKIKVRE